MASLKTAWCLHLSSGSGVLQIKIPSKHSKIVVAFLKGFLIKLNPEMSETVFLFFMIFGAVFAVFVGGLAYSGYLIVSRFGGAWGIAFAALASCTFGALAYATSEYSRSH